MLRLKALFVDAESTEFNSKAQFTRSDIQTEGPIFSFYYMRGTVEGGELKGTWNNPGSGATNSVVLWPDTMRYFSSEAQKVLSAV